MRDSGMGSAAGRRLSRRALASLLLLGGCARAALYDGAPAAGDPVASEPDAGSAHDAGVPMPRLPPRTTAPRDAGPVVSRPPDAAPEVPRPDPQLPPCPDRLTGDLRVEPGCHEPHVWSRMIGNSQNREPSLVGFDDTHAAFVAFRYMEWADLGEGRIATPDGGSRVLAKYDADGRLAWSLELPWLSFESMTVDAEGDVHLAGFLLGEQPIGDRVVTMPQGDADAIYVLELSGRDGSLTWARTTGTTQSSIAAMHVLALPAGETWLVTADLEASFVGAPWGDEPGLHRFGPGGQPLDSTPLETSMELQDAFVDLAGRAWVVASVLYDDRSSLDHDFVLELGPDGEAVRTVAFPNESWSSGRATITPDDGLVFATRLSSEREGMRIAKQTLDGDLLWEYALPSEALSYVTGLGADRFGRVAVTAENGGRVELAGVELRGRLFLGRFAPDGTPLWSHAFGPAEGTPSMNGRVRSRVHPDGDVYLAGTYFEGPTTFSADPALALPTRRDAYSQYVARLRFPPP